jgi:CheY-like chemotaxis protein
MQPEIFILEDDLTRIEVFKKMWKDYAKFIIAESFEEAEQNFDYDKKYDCIFLDHDLGGRIFISSGEEETNSGANFCRYLKNYQYKDVQIIIHSHNPIGALNMKAILDGYQFTNIIVMPFGSLVKMWNNGTLKFVGRYKYDEV